LSRTRQTRRVRPDAASITAGLVFLAMGLVYLSASDGHLHKAAQWTGSLLVLGLGLAWVIGAITRRRR
jgi:drug/metabolite transporter (DMT)-like permease